MVLGGVLHSMEASGSSTGYSFAGPLATIADSAFFRSWMRDEAYIARLAQAADPSAAANKMVAIHFQRDLALMVAGGRIAEEIDDLLARYMVADYRQHDPHLEDGRDALAGFFKMASAAGIDLWPPMPICVVVEADIVTLLLQAETPDGSEKFIPTMFRVRDGKMSEHWSAAAPPPALSQPA